MYSSGWPGTERMSASKTQWRVLLHLWCIASFCAAPVALAGTAKLYQSAARDSKATHCQFHGTVLHQGKQEPVTMHVFIRALAIEHSRLVVRGFSYMFSSTHIHTSHGQQQEAQVPAANTYNGTLRLESILRPTQLLLEHRRSWQPEVANAILADAPLKPLDDEQGEFWLRAEGFPYQCLIILERRAADTVGLDLGVVNRKGFVEATSVQNLSRHISTADGRRITEVGGKAGAVWVVTPMFSVSPARQAMLLEYHWRWHSQMGVVKYILYVLHTITELVMSPFVKAMVAAGHLELLLWDALPAHYSYAQIWPGGWPGHDGYCHQYVINNHAVLEQWTEDVFLILADLDEWLMTPKRMTVQEVMQTCPSSGIVAGISVQMRHARCTACSKGGKVAELETWATMLGGPYPRNQGSSIDLNLVNTPADPAANPYPLTLYEVAGAVDPNAWMPRKAIINPNYIQLAAIHAHQPLPHASYERLGTDTCVRFAHMINLHSVRKVMYYRNVSDSFTSIEAKSSWWWPADPRKPLFTAP